MAEWFVQVDGKRYGPFDSAKLVKLAQAGKIKPDDMVKKGRDGDWTPARRVRRLFDTDTRVVDGVVVKPEAPKRSANKDSTAKKPQGRRSSLGRTARGESTPTSPTASKKDKSRAKPISPAPIEPLFDLSEEFHLPAGPDGADLPPTLPPVAPTQFQRPRGSRANSERNIGVTLAKLSWQMPIIVFGFGAILGLIGVGEVPVVRLLLLLASALGFVAGPIALCLMAKYGSKHILVHALVGTGLHLTCCLIPVILIGVIGYQFNSALRDIDPTEFGDRAPTDVITDKDEFGSPGEPEPAQPHVRPERSFGSGNEQTPYGGARDSRNPFSPAPRVKNPFRPDSNVDDPVEPSDSVENPVEPGGESKNPFEPKDEADNPFEPAAESENPGE